MQRYRSSHHIPDFSSNKESHNQLYLMENQEMLNLSDGEDIQGDNITYIVWVFMI